MAIRIQRPSTGGQPAPEIVGGVGEPPPPGAPIEVATGADTPTDMQYANLDPNTVAALSQPHTRGDGGESAVIDPTNLGLTARELAGKYERTLAPLVATGPVVAAVNAPTTNTPPPGYQFVEVGGRVLLEPIVSTITLENKHVTQAPATEPPPPPPIEAHQLAGSNSDSPTRGVPRQIDDPGKVITGGFGAVQAMYYPLDGSELRKLVTDVLIPQLLTRLSDDLRFQLAITYPRVGVTVEVRVDGYPDDQSFTVGESKIVAQVRRAEVDPDGTRVAPDQLRAEAGLAIPRMQSIQAGGGAGNRQIVDVV